MFPRLARVLVGSLALGLLAVGLLAWGLAGALAQQATPAATDFKDRLPRIAPRELDQAMASFSLEPGFTIERAAAEPEVCDPVAMSFDADNRLYVVEMRDYSEDATSNLGRVRLLRDEDHDGRFETSENLGAFSWPTGAVCLHGGVIVAAAPDIWFVRAGVVNSKPERIKLFTGLNRSNVQGLVNSLRWGLDNRIHGATSTAGGELTRVGSIPGVWPALPPNSAGKTVRLSGRDFSFDPLTGDMRAESGGGQHGMCFDDWGHKFVSSNSDHIQQVMYEDRYVARNPYLAAPSPRVSIATDGPAAPVFRTSPVEPWRIVRTELRVSGKVPGIIEGGGKPAGYFTGATGVYVYRGDAFPAAFRGSAFIGDVGSNLVHRKVFEPHGVELRAKRVDAGREFLASDDIWFRPCQFGDGPDGCLYICDMYREVIEHPAALPPMIKQHLDLTSGRDRGRIYRVTPTGFTRPKLPRLSQASTDDLIAALAHPNGWRRETAARLLYERQEEKAVAGLEQLASRSESPLGRMHALYALAGLGQATLAVVRARLADPDPQVQVHAIRVAERLAADPGVREDLLKLAETEHPEVRLQLAFTLGEVRDPAVMAALARLALHPQADRWLTLAILSSAEGRQGELLSFLTGQPEARKADSVRGLIMQLAEQIGLARRDADLTTALAALDKLPADERPLAHQLFRSICEGASRAGVSAEKLASNGRASEWLAILLADAEKSASDARQSDQARATAIRTLGLAVPAVALKQLAPLLDGRQPQAVQQAALETLARLPGPESAQAIVAAWPNFTPQLRTTAVEALFARPERLPALLDAVAAGQIPASQLDPARLKLLANHRDPETRRRATELLDQAKFGRRSDVALAHQDVLKLEGLAARGKTVFQKTCAACHKLEGAGHEIGPNLAAMQNRGADAILLNLLDPNKEVNPQYVNYVATTVEGRSATGMLAAETAASVTLRRAEGQSDTLLRTNLEELKSTGLSIMPEGLEKQLSKQDLADVIAYLLSIR